MRKELDAFFKTTEPLAPYPRRATRAARRVIRGAVVALPPRRSSSDHSAGIGACARSDADRQDSCDVRA
jgi:hypothetical protein